MPSRSKSQQALFGQAYAAKKRGLTSGNPRIQKMIDGMTLKQLHDFAATKRTGLPGHVKQAGVTSFLLSKLTGLDRAAADRVCLHGRAIAKTLVHNPTKAKLRFHLDGGVREFTHEPLGKTASLLSPAIYKMAGVMGGLRAGAKAIEAIPAAVKGLGKMMGRGGNGVVHELPGVEGTVVKVPREIYNPETAIHPEFGPVPNKAHPLNVGQATHANNQGIELLRKQIGKPNGAPYPIPGGVQAGTEAAIPAYAQQMEETAKLPQGAFDAHVKQKKFLDSRGVMDDPSKASNLLIDPNGKRINMVDTTARTPNNTYNPTDFNNIVSPLIDQQFAGNLAWKGHTLPRRTQAAIRLTMGKARKASQQFAPADYDSSAATRPDLANWHEYKRTFLTPRPPASTAQPVPSMDQIKFGGLTPRFDLSYDLAELIN